MFSLKLIERKISKHFSCINSISFFWLYQDVIFAIFNLNYSKKAFVLLILQPRETAINHLFEPVSKQRYEQQLIGKQGYCIFHHRE